MKNKLPIELLYTGKVRELYRLEPGKLLMVASDRISAFDFILPTPIPEKGKILSQLSVFWFRRLESIIGNHLLIDNFRNFPECLRPFEKELAGRSLVVKEVRKLRIEAVDRRSGTVCGHRLPAGLSLSNRLPEPIFTPATKEEVGEHDRNISFEECAGLVGLEAARQLREKSLALYRTAAAYALERGVIIADTKFEFGYDPTGDLILIDEALTPDSSRFWESARYQPGREQESLDKQYVRNYLLEIKWPKEPPVPELPPEVVAQTREKYLQLYRIITGRSLDDAEKGAEHGQPAH
ncbi:MAG: Phosphoribosylaminoimidazole-succinocarboxamide synthase [candidate division TA06 bacterium ADurb.Bin417]|uniref:Phosphoribosylaminoimidazole-succinocarboxamide synthase n=1 Tax=candidate division TA06 bacterium ADurb.Bin417 TaxID=1852828 RepID=A0A1V5MJY0_UNCT6|nr:MAG: Phosphoribosylaminoimidazole-succinocarboxamide synthase [candidate division TA06 bacterium ADurb.Bin417]